ncbi:MAG: hypothetical protein SGJ27_20410 [Candidatus Melainabacteria bacterium]|nr:hypothetical protein [Candidatus Melainabacteria bacterium]
MAPNQGDGPDRAVQEKAQKIAGAFEKGVVDPAHNMKPAIDALQEAAHGDPQQYQQIMRVANNMLDHSKDANVQKFFGKYDIVEGSDANALVLKREDGAKFRMDARGKTTADNGASIEATRKDGAGNKLDQATDKDGTLRERVTSADGTKAVERYTDKGGVKWEIERNKQADGTLRPTKVTMPDGSKMEYEWKMEQGTRGTLYPTRMRESDPSGKVVKDYQMKVFDQTGRLDTANWNKKIGPSDVPANFYGTLVVDSAGNNVQTQRNPTVETRVNADGNWIKTNMSDPGNRKIDKGRRTK